MELDIYQNNFETKEIKLEKYIITIAIFIIIITIIVSLFNNFYYYYNGTGFFKGDNCFSILVDINDLNKVTKNNKILIEGTTFTYDITNISSDNFDYETNIYKSIVLNIKDLPDYLNIENNYVSYKIITKKDTIINYIFKTVLGE